MVVRHEKQCTRFHLLICYIFKSCHVQIWLDHKHLAIYIPKEAMEGFFLREGITFQLCRKY